VTQQLIDWTNSERVINDPSTVQKLHPAIVVQLAKDALEEPASFAKIYVQTIAKMKLHESMDQEQLDELEETLTQLQRYVTDKVTQNALKKLISSLKELDVIKQSSSQNEIEANEQDITLNEDEISAILNEADESVLERVSICLDDHDSEVDDLLEDDE